jgi:hypothetical protein
MRAQIFVEMSCAVSVLELLSALDYAVDLHQFQLIELPYDFGRYFGRGGFQSICIWDCETEEQANEVCELMKEFNSRLRLTVSVKEMADFV